MTTRETVWLNVHGMAGRRAPRVHKRPSRPGTPSPTFMVGGFGRVIDAATYLGFSVPMLYRLIRRGHLRAYRAGGRLLVLKRADCDAFATAHPIAEPLIVERGRR